MNPVELVAMVLQDFLVNQVAVEVMGYLVLKVNVVKKVNVVLMAMAEMDNLAYLDHKAHQGMTLKAHQDGLEKEVTLDDRVRLLNIFF